MSYQINLPEELQRLTMSRPSYRASYVTVVKSNKSLKACGDLDLDRAMYNIKLPELFNVY